MYFKNKIKNYLLFLTIFYLNLCTKCNDIEKKYRDETLKISDSALLKISNLSNSAHFMKTLDKILIPRVPGTEGHSKVRDFIIESMEELEWQVDRDAFTDSTPFGNIRFENIIATQNPLAERFLVLACHYDSKYFKKFEFLGATDSAVPCAMLINLAYTMNKFLKLKNDNNIGLMFIFFDGEEAFVEWGPKDSIYGARHLAAKWESENFLKKLDIFVLLDLIGGPDPSFYSFYKETENSYISLLKIEEKLSNYDILQRHASSGVISRTNNAYFQERSASLFVEDDHIPFLKRKVPILHLINIPFPEVWHTEEDNKKFIDFTTVENLNKIFRVFVAEYLKLPVPDN